ncbi:rab effector MyRIP isoform X5 [Esox lucius]|uniref:rab effector MyRIP isoform X5 n=1 Tax=Esox lucius TaxID=8010 RepID=UPI00057722F3|nr:rab effector MyRIP isoform X5 [Esox lucius]
MCNTPQKNNPIDLNATHWELNRPYTVAKCFPNKRILLYKLSEMKQELLEEGSRCSILSKQHRFNEHCCIRCCAPFTFLLNPKRPCLDCRYNVCKTCCTYSKKDKAWLCSACQKTRILRTQSLEWYYNNVKSRFKRFGSAKVLKTLYRKHIVERGGISDLPESSVNDGSNDNDGSICGSDSTFYRQSEGHSMAETLTVALRVAEEAIEEAIAKAEEFSDSLEKQNEARYLRDHKEELIEELATTIVQKIIQRRKRSEMQTEYDFVWPQTHGQPQGSDLSSPNQPPHNTLAQANQAHLRSSYSLWRSRSAFSLTSDDSPEKATEVALGAGGGVSDYTSMKKETTRVSSLPSWKSVDRLDNSSASSVLHSPDGNWIALQSTQHSRPSLLTKRKSLVFSVLERESGVVSAYDEMASESDKEEDEGGWGAALRQFRRKLSDETYYTDSQHDPEWTYTAAHLPVTSPSSGQYTNTETLNSDSESSSVPSARARQPHRQAATGKGPDADSRLHPRQAQYHQHQVLPSYPLQPESLDVNFNPKVTGDSSEAEDSWQSDQVRRLRRRRKSKREQAHAQTNQKYSAASLCSITTEVLKVLNATEELIGEAGGQSITPSECMSASESLSSSLETRKLDQKLTKMEENVYLAAGAVYGLEGALGDLEDVARGISGSTSDRELAFLEDQVATAAAQVHQSELQISNIEARILSLKTAGLNVTSCNRFSKFSKPNPKPQTLDTSRQQRRKLPAPPVKDSEQQVRALQL